MGVLLERISVVVDGYALQGFQSVEVTRSMQDGAMSFRIAADASTWSPQAMALRQGKQVQIYSCPDLGPGAGLGDLLLTGTVDDYESELTEDSHSITIGGRSKGRDAIDCPPVKHKTGLVKNKTLLQAAHEFDEFGVGWSSDQQLQPIAMIQRRPEEAMFDTIERYARRQGMMLVAQTDGSIKITRAGTQRHAGALVHGQSPVNRFGVGVSNKHKRSPVVVRGQRRAGTGKDNLRQEAQDDDGSGSYRPALVIAEGDHTVDDLKKRAKWERLRMAGFGTRPKVTASRWRDDGGLIWTPGYLVALQCAIEQIDSDFTLSTVTLSQRNGDGRDDGTRARLEFVDPAAHGGTDGGGSSDAVFSAGGGL